MTSPRFTIENSFGLTSEQVAELNQLYEANLSRYENPVELMWTGSDPHFFGPITVAEYVARQVLMDFDDGCDAA